MIQMTTMATWIREDEKLVLSSHQSCQDFGKFSRCKFEEFEAFEVDTNDKIIAVEIKLYNLTIPLLDLPGLVAYISNLWSMGSLESSSPDASVPA